MIRWRQQQDDSHVAEAGDYRARIIPLGLVCRLEVTELVAAAPPAADFRVTVHQQKCATVEEAKHFGELWLRHGEAPALVAAAGR